MRLREIVIPAFLLFAPSAWADEEAPDFSQGLSRLAELGLPEMKGARWVKLSSLSQQAFTESHDFSELDVRMSGNVWELTPENPDYLEFGTSQTIADPDQDEAKDVNNKSEEKPGIFGKMLRNYKEENPELKKKPETSEPVSFAARDAEKLATSLAKASVAEEIENAMRWGNSELPGRLLLFVAQLSAAGETESANLLAAALFRAVSDDQGLVDRAVSHLADSAYNKTAERFFEEYDWKAYQQDIRTLLEKYPRGWANAPAVALLLSKLEKRSSTPAKPSLPDIKIKPEALVLIDRLLEKSDENATTPEQLARARGFDLSDYPANQRAQIIAMLRAEGMQISYQNTGNWLLDTPEENADESPIGKIKAMGMDGLIALAAVADDETPVPHRNSGDRNSYYNSNESPAENIRNRYRNLTRPATRGEIATGLLSGVVPMPEDQYQRSSTDSSAIADTAIDFWGKNSNKSQVDLATIYIKEGNSNQKSQAATFLSNSEEPAAHKAFEAAVLASDEPLNLISEVDQYLSKRKLDAKPFADAYIKLVRDNAPSEQDLNRTQAGWQIREAGGLENYLKKLSLSVGDISLKKLIAKALKDTPEKATDGDEEAPSPIIALGTTIQNIPLNECMIEFGKVASVSTPAQWMEIHLLLQGRIYYELRNSRGLEDTEKASIDPGVLEIWKPLIARKDPLPDEGAFTTQTKSYGGKTTGDASALILELSTQPSLAYSLNSFAQIEGTGTAVMSFVRERVESYASGKEPTPWPDAENVSEERRDEISKKLADLGAAEIIPYATSLNRDERLAVMEIVTSYGESDPTPSGLLELRATIVTSAPIFAADHKPEIANKLGIAVGDKITPELVTRVSEELLKDASELSKTSLMFYPATMSLGSTFIVDSPEELDRNSGYHRGVYGLAQWFNQVEGKDVLLSVTVQGGTDIYTLENGKPLPVDSGASNSAMDALAKALEGKEANLPFIQITILSREDAEKINNQE